MLEQNKSLCYWQQTTIIPVKQTASRNCIWTFVFAIHWFKGWHEQNIQRERNNQICNGLGFVPVLPLSKRSMMVVVCNVSFFFFHFSNMFASSMASVLESALINVYWARIQHMTMNAQWTLMLKSYVCGTFFRTNFPFQICRNAVSSANEKLQGKPGTYAQNNMIVLLNKKAKRGGISLLSVVQWRMRIKDSTFILHSNSIFITGLLSFIDRKKHIKNGKYHKYRIGL